MNSNQSVVGIDQILLRLTQWFHQGRRKPWNFSNNRSVRFRYGSPLKIWIFAWGQARVQLGEIWCHAILHMFRPYLIPKPTPEPTYITCISFNICRIWYCRCLLFILQEIEDIHNESGIWRHPYGPCTTYTGRILHIRRNRNTRSVCQPCGPCTTVMETRSESGNQREMSNRWDLF